MLLLTRPLLGRHLTPVDVKERGERSVGGHLQFRPPQRGCHFLGFSLRGLLVAVPEGDPLPAAVVGELEKEASGHGMRKRAHPVPAPLSGGETPPLLRAGHRGSSRSEVTTARAICIGVAPTNLLLARSPGNWAVAFRGRSARRIFGALVRPALGMTPPRTRRPRWSGE